MLQRPEQGHTLINPGPSWSPASSLLLWCLLRLPEGKCHSDMEASHVSLHFCALKGHRARNWGWEEWRIYLLVKGRAANWKTHKHWNLAYVQILVTLDEALHL